MKLLIRYFWVVGICSAFFGHSVHSETMYVTDSIKITVRTGQSNSHKILTIIESGEQIEALEKGTQWTRVRLSDGKEGWVLNRYLTNNPTNKILLEKLEYKTNNLMAKTDSLQEENDQLKIENKKLRFSLANNGKILNNLREDYETLKSDSAEYLDLRSKYELVSNQLSELTQKSEQLEEQIPSLQLYYYIKWILIVLGILLVGLIIGASTRRPRRQSSLL